MLTNFGYTPTSGWAPGLAGGRGALAFDGTDDYVDCGSRVGPASGFSIFMWVNQLTARTDLVAAQYYFGVGAYFQFAILSDGSLFGRIQQSIDTVYIQRNSAAGIVTVGQWHLVGMTWDGGTTDASIKSFVDGQRVDASNGGSGSFTASYTGAVPLTIGSQLTTGPSVQVPFNGRIEDPRIYNYAVPAPLVAAMADRRTAWDLRWTPTRVAYFFGSGSAPATNANAMFFGAV